MLLTGEDPSTWTRVLALDGALARLQRYAAGSHPGAGTTADARARRAHALAGVYVLE
jgi:hypothetical protein